MFISCHCAVTNCEHMVDMLKHNISNFKAIDDVKMLEYHKRCYVMMLEYY